MTKWLVLLVFIFAAIGIAYVITGSLVLASAFIVGTGLYAAGVVAWARWRGVSWKASTRAWLLMGISLGCALLGLFQVSLSEQKQTILGVVSLGAALLYAIAALAVRESSKQER